MTLSEITSQQFSDAKFDEAISRAIASGLRAEKTSRPGTLDVFSGKNVYQATTTTCTCKAGRFGKPCKHVAYVAYLTVLEETLGCGVYPKI